MMLESIEQESSMVMTCSTQEDQEILHVHATTLLKKWKTIALMIQAVDTMHLHEALREMDKSKFLEAKIKELEAQKPQKHWEMQTIG